MMSRVEENGVRGLRTNALLRQTLLAQLQHRRRQHRIERSAVAPIERELFTVRRVEEDRFFTSAFCFA